MKACIATSLYLIFTFIACTESLSSKPINDTINGIRPGLSPDCLAHTSAKDTGIRIDIASVSKGLGAFASAFIPAGTFLGAYGGEIMTKEEVQVRFWNKGRGKDAADKKWADSRLRRGQGITGNYLLELPGGSFIDAEDGDVSDWCRFMNHISEKDDQGAYNHGCNVKPFLQSKIGGEVHKFPRMYAIRDIEEGEELCWDYGRHFFLGGNVEEH